MGNFFAPVFGEDGNNRSNLYDLSIKNKIFMDNLTVKIPVDKIMESDEAIIGFSKYRDTVKENFGLFFTDETTSQLEELLQTKKPFRLYSDYCQFILQVAYVPGEGFTIRLLDFKKDTDIAMRNYFSLKEKDWPKEDIKKILEIHLKISERMEVVYGIPVEKEGHLL